MRNASTCFRRVGSVMAILVFSLGNLLCQSFGIGCFYGGSSYLGEMQQTYYDADESKPAYGVHARLSFNKNIGLRIQYMNTTLSGNDGNQIEREMVLRNLNFSTQLHELGLIGELTLINFGIDREKIRARSFLFGGVAGIHFNPRAMYQGEWIDLQPLGTEGQNLNEDMTPYEKTAIVYPLGMGFEFNLTQKISFGVEVKYQFTNTDYLDDISGYYPDIEALEEVNPMAAQLSFRTPEMIDNYRHNPMGELRGDHRKNDTYLFFGATASFKIFKKRKLATLPTFFDDPINP